MNGTLPATLLLAIAPLVGAQQHQFDLAEPFAQPITTADAPASRPATFLADGTPIRLRFAQSISSRTAKINQEISLEVVDDLTVDRVVVLRKGTPAVARVIAVVPGKTMGRPGKLGVALESAHLANGEKLILRAAQENKGTDRVAIMTTAIAVSVFMFYPVAPAFLLTHGGNAKVAKGAEITAFVQGEMPLDLSRFDPPPPLPVSDPALAGTISLAIDSHPGGAQIEIDGTLAGNTPATLHLIPGNHNISLKKVGFTDWSQTLDITADTLRLTAQLDRETAKN